MQMHDGKMGPELNLARASRVSQNELMKTSIFQNSNENIVIKPQKAPKSFQKAAKISGQKSLQYFRCYFGKTMPS